MQNGPSSISLTCVLAGIAKCKNGQRIVYLELPDRGTLIAEKEVTLHILITVVQRAIEKLIRKRSPWECTQKSAAAVIMVGQELKRAGHE